MQQQLDEAARLRRAVKVNQAMAAYRQVVLRYPDCARAHHGLGLCLGFKGHLTEAVEELESATELAPLSPRILLDLAKTYMMAEMYVEGETTFCRVLKLDPDNADARTQLKYCQTAELAL